MSVDQVVAFFNKIQADETLRAEARTLRRGTQKQPVIDGLMKMAQGLGFTFDEETLEKGWAEWRNNLPEDRELPDEALEAVAGGSDCYYGA